MELQNGKKLKNIGETRWWDKEKSLFGVFGDGDNLFLVTIDVLLYIDKSGKFALLKKETQNPAEKIWNVPLWEAYTSHCGTFKRYTVGGIPKKYGSINMK
jgi:hypothetical protein